MTRSSLSAPSAQCLFVSSTTRLLTTALFILLASQACNAAYYGKLIGKLSELHHGVTGEVYAVDGRTLYVKDFTYDGEGPAAFFYAGTSKNPNGNGFRVRDERGTTDVLKKYRKKGITLTLPEGKTLNNIKWFSVWCDEFAVNFGDVRIPRGFDYPRPQKIDGLNGVHGVSSEPIVVVDAQTLLIPGFSYDGEAPDAKFWVGPGAHPTPQGNRVPDENGRSEPLRRYERKTIVLTLPGDLTVHQLGHFGVWCEAFTVDFGHIQIPANLNVPPSLKMLGVSPQSKLNCEVLEDSLAFEVRWAVAGDSIVVQLVGKLDAGQYMSFGLSATPERSVMVGGDVVVAWVDKQTLQGYAVDYFLDAKSQCSGGRGSCPDTRIQANTNSVRLLNAAMVNGYSIVTYQRPLKASDELDVQIRTNASQAILWAIGPLNERNEVSFHSHYLKTDKFIEFGRPPVWNCPMPEGDMQNIHAESSEKDIVVTTRRSHKTPPTPAPSIKTNAWEIPAIECYEPEDGVLYAQLGPTGGKHGYPAMTGHVGWGISWYINGLLIPVINVVRGQKYTFIVEGGDDPEVPARYHPFYITDDPVGGYEHKTPEEKAKVKIFAGVSRQGGNKIRPTGVGRLCNWIHDPNLPEADSYTSFGAFQRSLNLKCDHGEPGIVEWTPDANTPDTVYYQCFTHRYLGWKINVVDSCDEAEAVQASENLSVYVEPPPVHQAQVSDLESAGSIRVTSKVTQAPEFYDHHRNLLHHDHHHHHHQNHQNHQNHHHPHPNSQLDQMMRYHVHGQHGNYPHYASTPNNNQAMNLHGKLTMPNGNINNNNAQLTTATTRLNGPIGLASHNTREAYDLTNDPGQSYDDHALPMSSQHHYQSVKPIVIHHNHHYQQMPNHHHYPHLSHGVTRAQLNTDSMIHRHGPIGLMRPHRTDVRSSLVQSNHPPAIHPHYRETLADRDESSAFADWSKQFAPGNTGVNVTSDSKALSASSNYPEQHMTNLENDQQTRQTSAVPIAILSSSSPNQASSNLVTDQRPIMSYGQTKYPFSHPGTSQYVYSRPSQSHSTIINPHKSGQQLFIIRRPIVQQLSQRRPIIASMMMPTGGGPELSPPSSSRPMPMERKKAFYQGPSRQIVVSTGKQNGPQNSNYDNDIDHFNDSNNKNHHSGKVAIMENQQRAKFSEKMSTGDDDDGDDEITLDRNSIQANNAIIKPARNTGFDPDSIVIESGFKPIIRNIPRDANAARSEGLAIFTEHLDDYSMDEAERKNDNDDSYDNGEENFEPMFVPSPLDRNNAKKQHILKKLRKVHEVRRKTRLDNLDDMEMAADRSNSYYLPPIVENSKFADTKRSREDEKSRGTLVAYDGKIVDDISLLRSRPRMEEGKRSRGRLTSEMLSKTPQFGRYRGELPPPIPAQIKIEDSPRSSENRQVKNAAITTRLTAFKRNKRSSENHEVRASFFDSTNTTDLRKLDDAHPRDDQSSDDYSDYSDRYNNHSDLSSQHYNHTKHSAHEYDHGDRSHRNNDYDEPSTGEMIIANIQYVVLTIVLYYAI